MSRIYTYRIDDEHLPKGAARCIEWALTQWAKASKGRIQFFLSHGSPDIMFSGGKPPRNERNPSDPFEAYYFHLGNGVYSVIFDPDVKWSTSWWQRGADFKKLCLHELGHVILGPNHSDDPESIMFYRPQTSRIDRASASRL